MALKDLIRPTPTPAAERPPGITCSKYTRGEDKRCVHFRAAGACALPEEFMCVEWLKANAPASAPAAQTDAPANGTGADRTKALSDLTTEDIEAFKALGVEVQLTSEGYGDLWLVPAYTGLPRKEITPEHAATVMRVLRAFPGTRVVAIEKHSQPERPERPSRRP